MKKISEVFKTKTKRPTEYPNEVSIAELAAFTLFNDTTKYRVAEAYDELLRSWKFEVDNSADAYKVSYVDFKKALMLFKDGSSLLFSEE